MNQFSIRPAIKSDTSTIVHLIQELAAYEKLSHEAIMTTELIEKNVFENGYAHVLLAEKNGIVIGFALYFFNFSTFLGKPGLYLEDLFIEPNHRGKGYGKKLLIELASVALKKDCGRMEWMVLDWNTPSIEFYKSLGAVPMDEWTTYRLTESTMKELVKH